MKRGGGILSEKSRKGVVGLMKYACGIEEVPSNIPFDSDETFAGCPHVDQWLDVIFPCSTG